MIDPSELERLVDTLDAVMIEATMGSATPMRYEIGRDGKGSSDYERLGKYVAINVGIVCNRLRQLSARAADPSGGVNKMGVPEGWRELLVALLPAIDAYEESGRESVVKDGILHWRVTTPFYTAGNLRNRVNAMLAAAPQPEARNSCKHIHTTQSGDGLHIYCNTCNEDLSPQPEAKP